MSSFEPLINLLILLTILSITAERITNLIKLRREELRTRSEDKDTEKKREYGISGRSIWIGILVAILAKADFFEILTHLDSPWTTLGWVSVEGHQWIRAAATASIGTFLYALGGCVLTGLGLGFGSKFWHDLLGTVFEVRQMARKFNEKAKAGG